MKRLVSLLLAIAMVVSMIPNVFALEETADVTEETPATAVEQETYADTEGDYTYDVENGEATITGYTGAGGDITIPSELGGYPVTTIGGGAFYDCCILTSVTIPDSVTNIGRAAFSGCSSLTSLNIPDGVTSIEGGTFFGCESLTGITIPDSVTTIGNDAFELAGLTSVTIPDSVTTIGLDAFYNCYSLEEVTIGSGVTSIGNYAFDGCDKLTGIWVDTDNANYSSDDRGVLFNKAKTTLLLAPNGISGAYTIPDSVTTIRWSAFGDCSSLTSVTIPDSVTSIEEDAFCGCNSLTNVTIGNGVTSIGFGAFGGCDSLTAANYGGTPEQWKAITIGKNNDRLCAAVVAAIVGSTDYSFKVVDNSQITITGYTGAGGDITIPSELGFYPVTAITGGSDDEYYYGAFYGCDSLTSVTIPDSVTTIGYEAFYDCNNLASVTLGNSVETIGSYAFGDCDNLTSIIIPDSVTSVDYCAFGYCDSLTDVYYGGTKEQWNAIYISDNNTPLTNATIHFADGTEQPSAKGYAFTIENGEATITGYTGAGGDITIPSTLGGYPVTTIGDWAFEGSTSLTSVIIPDSVTTIGEYAFYYCDSLISVAMPDSVITIGVSAFQYCYCLTSVTIPNNVTTIGSDAFTGCDSLNGIWVDENNPEYSSDDRGVLFNKDKTTLIQAPCALSGDYTIPDSVTTVGKRAFRWNYGLISVTIGNSVSVISDFAFSGSRKLASVVIPDNVTTIGNFAFYESYSLTSVTIGSGVTVIGTEPFSCCEKLTGIWVDTNNTAYCSDDRGVLFNKDKTALIQAPGAVSDDYTIPISVTTIGGSAFAYCFSLTSVTIGDSVTTIDSEVFASCTGLTSVTIGDNVATIGQSAFEDCNNLTDVYYSGTDDQWNAIEINEGNEPLTNATIHFAEQPEAPDAADYEYTVENGEATITDYTGAGGDITIPSTLGGYPVTAIDNYAFSNCDSLTSVTIPDSVTTIGDRAFSYCEKLTSLTIPDSVTTIGSSAFYVCDSLTSVTIPDSVTTIGDRAFSNCTSLTDVTIPDSVITIGDEAFRNCTSLTAATISDSVTTIGDGAFSNCTSLISVTIPGSITSFGNSAFKFCHSLTSVTICNSVTAIGDDAFYYCDSLTSVIIPDSVTTIGDRAFSYCEKLTSLTIPDSVTTIGNSAFYCCSSLISVTIPDSVTTIGDNAFTNCQNLTSLTIPDSVTTIGNSAFSSCTSLTGIWASESNPNFSSDDRGVLFNKDKTVLVYAPCGLTGSYTIPDSVTTIGRDAFYGCDSLTSVTIGDGVTTIGDRAFSYCEKLTSLTIPDSVNTIGNSAFSNCTSLTSVTIPDSVTTIGEYAFAYCLSLTSMTIGDSVTTIGNSAFSYCYRLTDVYYGGTEEQWNAISIGSNNKPLTNATLHIVRVAEFAPTCTVDGYTERRCTCGDVETEVHEGTKLGHTEVEIPAVAPDCTNTGLTAGVKCDICGEILTAQEEVSALGHTEEIIPAVAPTEQTTGLTEGKKCSVCGEILVTQKIIPVLFPCEYTIVDGEAIITEYKGSGGDITIPETIDGYPVTAIGEEAFRSCASLTGVTIGDNITTIGDFAFCSCPNLEAVTIGDNVTTIGGFAFYNCTNLTSASIGDSVTTIGHSAFYSCSQLSAVNIPDSVTTIDDYAFYHCISLTAVNIPDSITTIGDCAFCDCSGLTDLTIGSGVTTIGSYAFSYCSGLTSVNIPVSVTAIDDRAFHRCKTLTDVYYAGAERQWNKINIGNDNEYLNNANIHFAVQEYYEASNGEESFETIQEAFDAYEDGVIQLQTDAESVTISKDTVVDLNGFGIAFVVATGGELIVMDRKTDDYTIADGDYGKIVVHSGKVKPADGYVAITEKDGTSFHKVGLETADMVLRGEDAGIYYNCIFSGDELVASHATSYGVALSVKGKPEIGLHGTAYSIFHGFKPGHNTPSTWLKNVMKQTNTPAQNARNAELQVYGRAYIQIGDTYIYGETESRSFRQQVEKADGIWTTLNDDQKAEVQQMYRTFKANMENWLIPNIKASI